MMKDIPKRNPTNARELDEDDDLAMQLKDNQIQHLKDRLRIEQEGSPSLRNQIKVLKNGGRESKINHACISEYL